MMSSKKIRVLQIISTLEMGGIENQLLLFLQRYDRSRLVVDVACTGSCFGYLKDKYLETGTKLLECRWSSYLVPYIWRLFHLLRRQRYDVIHTRTSMVSGAAVLAGWLAGVPVRIASYHNVDAQWRHPGLLNRLAVGALQWITGRWASRILSVSRANLDLFYPDWESYPEKFELCFNGVDLTRFAEKPDSRKAKEQLGIPAEALVVGNVGTMRKQKNHKTFIDVARRLSEQFEDLYFLLVGDGPLRKEIERQVEQKGLSSRFVFTGNRSDIPHMLVSMDVFLMPSLYEGFGTVAIEAQMCEVPVVASEIPCIREALCPGMQDFFFDVHDDKGMAEQIKILLENPEWRYKLGREGREYVRKKFSIDNTVEQLESLYNPADTSNC